MALRYRIDGIICGPARSDLLDLALALMAERLGTIDALVHDRETASGTLTIASGADEARVAGCIARWCRDNYPAMATRLD